MHYMLLPLYNQIKTFVSLDPEDYATHSQRRWYRWGDYGVHGRVLLHRAIIEAPSGLEVDHESLNKRDNRRANLRLATHAQNHQNKASYPGSASRFRGVTFDRSHRGRYKWAAKHKLAGRTHNLGRFETEEEAAEAAAAFRRQHMPFSLEGSQQASSRSRLIPS